MGIDDLSNASYTVKNTRTAAAAFADTFSWPKPDGHRLIHCCCTLLRTAARLCVLLRIIHTTGHLLISCVTAPSLYPGRWTNKAPSIPRPYLRLPCPGPNTYAGKTSAGRMSKSLALRFPSLVVLVVVVVDAAFTSPAISSAYARARVLVFWCPTRRNYLNANRNLKLPCFFFPCFRCSCSSSEGSVALAFTLL